MSIVDSLARACSRFDDVRASLRWAESVRTGGSAIEQGASVELRASAFVAISGAIEQWFREYVDWLTEQVLATGTSHRDLSLSLHAVVSTDDFRSLQSMRDPDKVLERRIALLERTNDHTTCSIPIREDELGLTGETIRPTHVSNIWRLFRLPGSGFGSISQHVALRVFADNRNDFAHGKCRSTSSSRSLSATCPECWRASEISRRGASTVGVVRTRTFPARCIAGR